MRHSYNGVIFSNNSRAFEQANIIPSNQHGLAKLLVLWQQRFRQRKSLMDLSNELLDDIGLTREQALIEGNKPFWKS